MATNATQAQLTAAANKLKASNTTYKNVSVDNILAMAKTNPQVQSLITTNLPKGVSYPTAAATPAKTPTVAEAQKTVAALQTQAALPAQDLASQAAAKAAQAQLPAAQAALAAATAKAAAAAPTPAAAAAALTPAQQAQRTQFYNQLVNAQNAGTLTPQQVTDIQSQAQKAGVPFDATTITTFSNRAAQLEAGRTAAAQQALRQPFINQLTQAQNSGTLTRQSIDAIVAQAQKAGATIDPALIKNYQDAAQTALNQKFTNQVAGVRTQAELDNVLAQARSAGATVNQGYITAANKNIADQAAAQQATQQAALGQKYQDQLSQARTQAEFDKVMSDARAAGATINQGFVDRYQQNVKDIAAQQAAQQAKIQSDFTAAQSAGTDAFKKLTVNSEVKLSDLDPGVINMYGADLNRITDNGKIPLQMSDPSKPGYITAAQMANYYRAGDTFGAQRQAAADYISKLPPPQGNSAQTITTPGGFEIVAVPDDPITGQKGGYFQSMAGGIQRLDAKGQPTGSVIPTSEFNKQTQAVQSNIALNQQQLAQQEKELAAAAMSGNVKQFEAKLPTAEEWAKAGKSQLRGPDGATYSLQPANLKTGTEAQWVKQDPNTLAITNISTGKTVSNADYAKNYNTITTANNEVYAQQRAEAAAAAKAAKEGPGLGDFFKLLAVATLGSMLIPALTGGGAAAGAAGGASDLAAGAVGMAESGATAGEIASALTSSGVPSATAASIAETATGLASGAIDAASAAASSGIGADVLAMANATADPIAALNAAAGWTTSDMAYLASIGVPATVLAQAEATNIAMGLPQSTIGQTATAEVSGQVPAGSTAEVASAPQPVAPTAPGAPPQGSIPVAGPNGEQLYYDGTNFYNADGTINAAATAKPGEIVASAGEGTQVAGTYSKDGTIFVDGEGYAYPRDPATGTVNLGGEPIGKLSEAQMEAAKKAGELVPGGDFGAVVPGAENVGAGGLTPGGTAISGAETAAVGGGGTAAGGVGGATTAGQAATTAAGTVTGGAAAVSPAATAAAAGEAAANAAAAAAATGAAATAAEAATVAASGLTASQVAALGGTAAAAAAIAAGGTSGAAAAATGGAAAGGAVAPTPGGAATGGAAATGGTATGTGVTGPSGSNVAGGATTAPAAPAAPAAPVVPSTAGGTVGSTTGGPAGTETMGGTTAGGTTAGGTGVLPVAAPAVPTPVAPTPAVTTTPAATTGTGTATAPTTTTTPTTTTGPGTTTAGTGLTPEQVAAGVGTAVVGTNLGTGTAGTGGTATTGTGGTGTTGTGGTATTGGPGGTGGTGTTVATPTPLSPVVPTPATTPPVTPHEVIAGEPVTPVDTTTPETAAAPSTIPPWALLPLLPLVLPKPVINTPNLPPLPPTEWGKVGRVSPSGLNPGWITNVPQQYAPSGIRSQYYWGEHPYQPGPTFSPELYKQVPAPAQPWGLQELYTPINPLTYASEMTGVPPVYPAGLGPVPPTTQA